MTTPPSLPPESPEYVAGADRIFLLGAAGTGMRGLGFLLHARGKTIIGADQALPSAGADPALAAYEWVTEQEGVACVTSCNLLIRSDGVPADHPVVTAAVAADIPSIVFNQAVGELTKLYTTIAIAGTHGKTSTTAMLAHILITTGHDPSVLIGARMPAWNNQNARLGHSDLLVVEADEYRDHFLTFAWQHLIITSIDFDHPDFFASAAATDVTFTKLVGKAGPTSTIVTTAEVHQKHDLGWPTTTVAVTESLPVPLVGAHMRMNATLAIRMAAVLGVLESEAVTALQTFPGVARRLEEIGTFASMLLVSDYGHHPAEIAATIAAAREKYPDQRLAVIVEIHTPERLHAFGHEYQLAIQAADEVILTPVFIPTGRSHYDDSVATQLAALKHDLVAAGTSTVLVGSYRELPDALTRLAKRAKVAVAFTAGILDKELRNLVN